MSESPLDPITGRQRGEALKADAFANLEANRERWVLRGRRALLATLLDAGVATADDVRDAVTLPPRLSPKCFGSVPGLLARAKIIRADGYAKTCRPTAHARPLTVWRLIDAPAAQRWLRDHPDPDDDDGTRNGAMLDPSPSNATGPAMAVAEPVEIPITHPTSGGTDNGQAV
jgi:hypothetical protein